MYSWIFLLLLIWPMFWVIRVLLVTRLLMGLEFCLTTIKTLASVDIPLHIQDAAKPWIAQLEGFGFQRLGGWRLHTTTDVAFDDYAIVMGKPDQPVRAIIQPYEDSARSGECWLSLRTTRQDASEIVTASHAPEELLPLAPGLEMEVLRAASPDEVVQRHQARITAARAAWWPCPDLHKAATREQHIRDAILGYAHGEHALRESGTGVFSYRPMAAIRRAVLIMRRATALKAQRASQRSVVTSISAESQLEFDLHQYRQQGALRRGRFSLKMKTAISSVSFLVFAGVLAWQYSLVVAVTLVVALVIHECGHLFGMRWFGYRDTQLLFVPFFGGAAIGHDEKVLSPWQHIVIILLGPLPGIFIALMLLVYMSGGGAPAWVTQVAVTTLVLNAFNLLPILPLDGGQIVDYAFASRFPRVRVLFLAISAIGMILFGLGLGGTKILFGVGIATLIRLPVEWRLAGMRRGAREEFPDGGDEEPIVRRLIVEMREPEWKKTPMAQRLQMVRGLQQVLRMPRPGFGTICFALAGFTAPLWLGAPLALWAVARQGDARIAQAHARAEVAGLKSVSNELKPTGVAVEENAAVPYEQARALARDDRDEEESTTPAQKNQIVALLRAAAAKRIFVPSAGITAAKGFHSRFDVGSNSSVVSHLNTVAAERLRYQESAEAAALAIDALKLLRLMQAAPDVLDWYDYKFVADTSWHTIEAALATGVKLPASSLADLRLLCVENADISFATIAMPRGLLAQGRALDDSDYISGGSSTQRILRIFQRVNPFRTDLQVEAIDQAIAVHETMQAVARGEWPVLESEAISSNQAALLIAQLGDFIARERQAKTALLLLEQRQRGVKVTSLEKLSAGKTDLVHPYTRATMQLAHRGSLDVLSFSNDAGSAEAADELVASSDLLWRLPAEQ